MLKRKIISGLILLGITSISYAQYANVEQLNSSASCDSTCSIDPNKVQTLSGQSQRLGNCGYGYIGSNLEERVINQDGSWTNWRETSRDNCACSPLTENQEVACPTNQKGTHIETRDWTCPSVAQGEYTQWVTKSNTCDYYYLSTSTEEQEVSCPLNQRGTHIQTRNYENWSDNSKRNYTAWTTKSNTCDYYLTTAGLIETGTTSCPAGQSGTITQTRTYERWSDGNARNHGAWTEVSRNCVNALVVNHTYGAEEIFLSCKGNGCSGDGAFSRTKIWQTDLNVTKFYHPVFEEVIRVVLSYNTSCACQLYDVGRPASSGLVIHSSNYNQKQPGTGTIILNGVRFTVTRTSTSRGAFTTGVSPAVHQAFYKKYPATIEYLY